MKLISVEVTGEIGCKYEFEKINVILGDNNSGKSTLIKLILYCLGAPIKSFIEEIEKEKLCESVTLEIEFKTRKQIRIIRKLPASDAILVTPIKSNEELVNDEIVVYSVSEFSDYLLENEGYSIDKIAYAKNKMASFRFYFLLRAIYVDQDTVAHNILSDLDMGHDYFTGQPIIKKSIIEKLLGKDNTELQKIRVLIQELNKIQNDLNTQISFLNNQKSTLEEKNDMVMSKVDLELLKISEEKDDLVNAEYEKVCKVKNLNDVQISNDLFLHQKQLKEKVEQDQIIKLEINDLENVIKSLTADSAALNYKIAAKDVLEDLPILYCPNCLSELSEETIKKGLCENCHKKTIEEKIMNSATMKKTLNDSIFEAGELLQIKRNNLQYNRDQITDLEKKIREEKKNIFTENQYKNNLIQDAIFDIKHRLEYLIKQENVLLHYRKIKNDLENSKRERGAILEQLKEYQEQLLKADNKASLAMGHYDMFLHKFSAYLGKMFKEITACGFDDNYMPLIDNNKISLVASASLKVAIRLTYILALFNTATDNEKNAHLGILLLDSPKDKDLDDYRFAKYLEAISEECNGQIVITGSLSDKEIYKEKLKDAKFFDELTTDSKLLKKKNRGIDMILT